MGLFEILVKRELTLECLQLPSINPLLNNACMPTLKSKLNEVLKISCIRNNIDISKMGPILEISILLRIHEIFRTSFSLLLRVGIQALLSKGLILGNCKHSRVNSRFTKI